MAKQVLKSIQTSITKKVHSRDIAILSVLLWFSAVHYLNLFQYFLSTFYVPIYFSWKFPIFCYACINKKKQGW